MLVKERMLCLLFVNKSYFCCLSVFYLLHCFLLYFCREVDFKPYGKAKRGKLSLKEGTKNIFINNEKFTYSR